MIISINTMEIFMKIKRINYLKYSIIFFSILLGLALYYLFSRTTLSEDPQKICSSFRGNLKGLTPGLPGHHKIKKARTAFLPNEKMSVEGSWRPRAKDYEADFIWTDPENKIIYTKKMNMQKNWTRTHVYFRGSRPMAAGRWHVLVKSDGKYLGGTSFKVVRKTSEIPVKQQLKAFASSRIQPAEAILLDKAIRQALQKKKPSPLPAALCKKKAKLIIRIFKNGKNIHNIYGNKNNIESSLQHIYSRLQDFNKPYSCIEMSLIHKNSEIPCASKQVEIKLRENMGFTIKLSNDFATLLPSVIWQKNLNQGLAVLRQLAVEAGHKETAWQSYPNKLFAFYTQQYLLAGEKSAPQQLYFGRTPQQLITGSDLQRAIALAVKWFMQNQHPGGRYMYLYYPHQEKEAAKGWCLRDLNAQFVLAQIAMDNNNQKLKQSVLKNLQMYKQRLVTRKGKTFLHWQQNRHDSSIAATAFILATLSLLKQDTTLAGKLAGSILALQQDNGKFNTDFLKANRPIDQQYYPGETLLALSHYYDFTRKKDILQAADKAFTFYREFWKDNKKGPFVPWQARAYSRFYEITGREKYKNFVFILMDWMLDKYPPRDDRLPGKKGAMHWCFASTGVYTEGLAAACKLAQTVKDHKRFNKYRRALASCAGYLINLQYHANDCYLYQKPRKITGAMAFKPTDNKLRLDSTYHAISALHMIHKYWPDLEKKFAEQKNI